MKKKRQKKYKSISHGYFPFSTGEIGMKLQEYKLKLLKEEESGTGKNSGGRASR